MIRLLKIGAVALCFGYVAATLARNLDEFRALEFGFRPGPLVAGFPLALAYLVGRALVWHRIAARLIGPTGLRTDVLSWLGSLVGKYLPGKLFLLVGRVTLYRSRGAPAGRVGVAFAVEASCGTLASLSVFAASRLGGSTPLPGGWAAALATLAAALVVATHPAVFTPLARLALRAAGHPIETIALRWRDVWGWTFAMACNWMLLGAGFTLLLRSLTPVAADFTLTASGAFAIAGVAGALAVFAPSGIGVREGVLTLVLSGPLGPGVAAAAAILARLWLTLAEAMVSGAALWVVRAEHVE